MNVTGIHQTNSAKKLTSSDTKNDDILELQRIQNGRFSLYKDGLKELDAIYHIRQIRFYCKSADGQSTIDIATENNKKGRQVVDHFLGKTMLVAANACGAYYKLPEDNSRMAADCTKMRWAAKPADNWYALTEAPILNTDGKIKFNFARSTAPAAFWWGCDNFNRAPTEAGGQWMVYVR